jgi:rRNA maturation endonuclease Nob1
MLVCLSCNIEYDEERKFCRYCGNHLVPKEDLAPNKKDSEKEKEKSNQKLICPNCKTVYEFGTSCIRCGSDLVSEIPSGAKEVLEQTLTQALKEAKATLKPKTSEGPIHLQTIQDQLIEIPRKNLICPHCRIVYERGNSCVRCGSSLVAKIVAQDAGAPEPPSTPDHAFDPGTPHKTLTGPVEGSEPKIPSPSSPKRRDGGPAREGLQRHAEWIEREQPSLFSDSETDKTLGAPKQDPAATSVDRLERRSIHPRKRKIDYRRLFMEVGSISTMVLAGGYFAWSIYSHVTEFPEPMASRLEEVSTTAGSNPPNPLHATPQVPVSQESRKAQSEQRSVISKEKNEAAPSSTSIPSDGLVVEALETGKIKDLLEHIRQANLQKDIDLFLSCYATDFKNRDGKRKATLSFWKKFDYLELSYDLKRTSIRGDMAKVKIEWVIKISSKAGGNAQESRTFFDAILKKEEGSWRILEVKELG